MNISVADPTSSARNTVSAFEDIDVRERRLEALSELPGIVIGPEVDKEQAGAARPACDCGRR